MVLMFINTISMKNKETCVSIRGCVVDPAPLPLRMVQSWFIHKILAEHKRRGLHPCRPVTRCIPGGEAARSASASLDTPAVSMDPADMDAMSPPRGTDSPPRGTDSPPCGTDSPPRGTDSPAGTPEDASSPSSSEEEGQDTPFVPTVTAISSTPDFQWMVQPTITSASPSLANKQANEAQSSNKTTPKAGGRRGKSAGRKGKTEQLSPEEEEKKRIRRERNKMAAAKCRNRRRELTDTLQAETDKLEEEKATLETEIAILLKEKERLEFILAAHKPVCQMSEEMECVFQESAESPELLSGSGDRLSEESIQEAPSLQDMDMPSDPSTAISGNSNILLCSSAEMHLCELEASLDLKEGLLDSVLPSLEEKTPMETARSVPDIDLSSSLGVSDWETLYKSVSNDLEPLSTPVVTSTPTCSSYLSVFTFACPELDSLADELDNHKSGKESVDILNSPTLLAL